MHIVEYYCLQALEQADLVICHSKIALGPPLCAARASARLWKAGRRRTRSQRCRAQRQKLVQQRV